MPLGSVRLHWFTESLAVGVLLLNMGTEAGNPQSSAEVSAFAPVFSIPQMLEKERGWLEGSASCPLVMRGLGKKAVWCVPPLS